MSRSDHAFAVPPDPGRVGTVDEVSAALRFLKVWAGDPSYDTITDRINKAWKAAGRAGGELAKRATVADCFRTGRRRLNTDLVIAAVQALHPDVGYVAQWRQALRVAGGETTAASQVRAQDTLPQGLPGFTGRAGELTELGHALRRGCERGGPVVVSAIAGMAGVGKTQLAIRAGQLLIEDKLVDRVLFVNLRGFHPDPAQPPADPAAVLDGFLRLLGVPGQAIPHDLAARAAAYRDRLAGTRTLVVLDNAADERQLSPLLPDTPGCPVLVTSRRDLTALDPADRLAVDVFTPAEAVALLTLAAPGIPAGDDPHAAARIAHRCGHLPLAIGLVGAHIRSTPGWTLTEHAGRLDERHRDRRMDTGVELALDLSYQHLPAEQRRLLRLAALHPGQDLDAYAAAALAGTGLRAARAAVDHLCRDHLLQRSTPGRYVLHDLVRAYAARHASDEDAPSERRAALTRLFDYYLATAAAAMDTAHPAEAHRRPRIAPPSVPTPDVTGLDAARGWLDTERPTLAAVAAHTAAHGWTAHTTRLSTTLFRYLNGGHYADALAIHGHALRAAQQAGDSGGQAHALNELGTTQLSMGKYGLSAELFQQALGLFRESADPGGQARVVGNLGVVEERLGRFRAAADYNEQALALYAQAGDRVGQARALGSLGVLEARLGRDPVAADRHSQALALCREAGDRIGEASALNNLADVEGRLGRPESAAAHLQQALALFRELGNLAHEASVLDTLGTLYTDLDRPGEATDHHQQALAICRALGDQDGEAWALNGLGEAARAAGHVPDSVTHHTAACAIAGQIGNRNQQARAHTGLGHAHRSLGEPARARDHYQRALTLYAELEMPGAGQLRAYLAAVDDETP